MSYLLRWLEKSGMVIVSKDCEYYEQKKGW